MGGDTTKAVIYARYSSTNQREESIEGQIRECKDFASKNNIIIIGEYCDRAISGKTDKRPEFQRMIKDSEKGKFDTLLLYTIDRFARNRYDSAMYKAKLKKNGVKLIYVKQPISQEPEGIILESVLEGYAEYYSENLSRSVKRGLKENALQLKASGSMPLGYQRDDSGHYAIEPMGAKIVKEIFELYAQGLSVPEIVSHCNSHGYKTSRGKEFVKNSIPTILRNDKYIGVYRYMEVVDENAIPPIIDKNLWETVQSRLTHNFSCRAKNKAKEDFLLTPKLFCGHCGSLMTGETGTSHTGKIHRYYKCNCRKYKHGCDKQNEQKEPLEELIVKHTVNTVLTDENIELIATKAMELIEKDFADTSYLVGLQSSMKETDKKITNIMKAIEQGIITPTTKARLEELEQERDILIAEISVEEMKKPSLSKERIMYWLTSFRDGSIHDENYRRHIVDALVNSIYLYDTDGKGRKIVFTFNVSGQNTSTLESSSIDGLSAE
ncbi:recombinase family protein [Lachnospiraceae bacterium OttesenSCG-928-D06]|nr:recombinase family protein [Lachnospiraceae bacterium OttesenSCG-928-D06]